MKKRLEESYILDQLKVDEDGNFLSKTYNNVDLVNKIMYSYDVVTCTEKCVPLVDEDDDNDELDIIR